MDTIELLDRPRAVEVLALSFADDPVLLWTSPDADARPAQLSVLFEVMVDAYAPHGRSAVTADGAGVALWRPSGQPLMTPEQEQAFGARLGEAGDPDRLLSLSVAMQEQHPLEPHLYLGFLGVLPDRQGQGLGAALLAPGLARCDAEGLPAFLEATTRDSARLYARHGFLETGEIVVPDGGPVLWPMWREPRS